MLNLHNTTRSKRSIKYKEDTSIRQQRLRLNSSTARIAPKLAHKHMSQGQEEGYSLNNSLCEERSDGDETTGRKAEEDVGRRGESAVFGTVTASGSRWLGAAAAATGGTTARAAQTSGGISAGRGS